MENIVARMIDIDVFIFNCVFKGWCCTACNHLYIKAGTFKVAYCFVYSIYFLLSYIMGIQYLLAAVAGFILGTTTNYLISKYMVFPGKPKSRTLEVTLVFLISGIGFVILEVGLYTLTDIYGIHYLVSKLIMTGIIFLWNFFARKTFLYSERFNVLKEA